MRTGPGAPAPKRRSVDSERLGGRRGGQLHPRVVGEMSPHRGGQPATRPERPKDVGEGRLRRREEHQPEPGVDRVERHAPPGNGDQVGGAGIGGECGTRRSRQPPVDGGRPRPSAARCPAAIQPSGATAAPSATAESPGRNRCRRSVRRGRRRGGTRGRPVLPHRRVQRLGLVVPDRRAGGEMLFGVHGGDVTRQERCRRPRHAPPQRPRGSAGSPASPGPARR